MCKCPIPRDARINANEKPLKPGKVKMENPAAGNYPLIFRYILYQPPSHYIEVSAALPVVNYIRPLA
jgi:hypothetical protein